MKKFVLYCDRCASEGAEDIRAITKVWIRTGGVRGSVCFDVCAEHLAMIVGAPVSSNGASAPVAASTPTVTPGFGKRSVLGHERAKKILALMEKRPRFTIDDANACGTPIGPVLRYLVAQGKLEAVMMGVYQKPGYRIPPPPSLEAGAEAAAKLVKARPGIRTTYLAPLLGLEPKQWKPTLAILRDKSLVRSKGTKSAMRLYPKT